MKHRKTAIIMCAAMITAAFFSGCGSDKTSDSMSSESSSIITAKESSVTEGSSETEQVVSDNSNAVISASVSSSSIESAADQVDIDNRTDIPDGNYTPEKFTWSGGSGRVNITCNEVEVEDGRSYATIQFSSTHYIYVKAGGIRINGDGTGTFRIPVLLNENNTIIGCTTAMSVPHEIEYSLFVTLGVTDQTYSASSDTPALDENYTSFDETAPAISGFTFQSAVIPQNASLFRIFQYDQNVSLVEVQLHSDASAEENASEEASEADAGESSGTDSGALSGTESAAETTAGLFRNNIIKYLIVPEQTELPAGTEKQAIVIQKPCAQVFIASEQVSASLTQWGLSDAFQTVDAGSYNAWDLKTLLQSKTSLIIEDGQILSDENMDIFQKNVNASIQMNIPMFIDQSADENRETAQTEWKQVYQLFFS
ncbi:MAG: hypothetical protein ACI4ET_07725 [Bilifractor sp.]